jgi:hypothetical protein
MKKRSDARPSQEEPPQPPQKRLDPKRSDDPQNEFDNIPTLVLPRLRVEPPPQ